MSTPILDAAKKAYADIFKLLKKNKDVCVFDIEDLETRSKLHLCGLELKELYGLNIDVKQVRSFNWIECGEYVYIGWFGDKYNRTVSWSDDGKQPIDEQLVIFKFSTGAYIFGEDYPTDLFQKFFLELKSFNPDYCDSHNHCLYFNVNRAKDIFNSFNDILKKYYEINREDAKKRKIERMKLDLAKLEQIN